MPVPKAVCCLDCPWKSFWKGPCWRWILFLSSVWPSFPPALEWIALAVVEHRWSGWLMAGSHARNIYLLNTRVSAHPVRWPPCERPVRPETTQGSLGTSPYWRGKDTSPSAFSLPFFPHWILIVTFLWVKYKCDVTSLSLLVAWEEQLISCREDGKSS